ncbi:LLGL1 [Cordylochernes scorpioides]|uniref:RNA-directed DNA polymerase n=1 Tax=Cordylochernes scorpioides TaxID=51811 RepID=A0ABY6K0M9_9ARAC|nr:LLGL1 [Cordylochernes scorpioides]
MESESGRYKVMSKLALKEDWSPVERKKLMKHGGLSEVMSKLVLGLIAFRTKEMESEAGRYKCSYGEPGVELYGQHSTEAMVQQLFFLSNKGKLISLCKDNSLHLWELNPKDNKWVLESVKSCSLEGRLNKISTCLLHSSGEHLYIGTEGGNIYLLDVASFEMSDSIIYQDVVMQNVPEDYKLNPGAVEAIAEHPNNPGKILIGYDRGLKVLWDIKELNAEHTYVGTQHVCDVMQQLESLCWHRSGTQFMSAHNDGSYIVWNTDDPSKPDGAPNAPYGPFPCKPIRKILWKSAKGQDGYVIFSGGMPRANFGDRHTITIMQGEKHEVLDFTSKVIDFFTISDSHEDSECDNPHSLVVLVEEELVVLDLDSEGWLPYAPPYLSSLHASSITCCQHAAAISPAIWTRLQAAGQAQRHTKYSSRPWPITGGNSGDTTEPASHDLLITGHEDGSVRFWDATGVALSHIYTMTTARLFAGEAPADTVDEAGDEWPPFRRVGTFDPFSDDPRLGIKKVHLCVFTGTLAVAGTAGQILIMELKDQSTTMELTAMIIMVGRSSTVTNVNVVGERGENFVWKGHDQLTARKEELEMEQGYQPKCLVQLHPPAAVTALALHSNWGLVAVGTAHGLAVVDYMQSKGVMTKCTLNPNDISAAGDAAMSRRKSFKKSLRESFRRLRKGRSQRRAAADKAKAGEDNKTATLRSEVVEDSEPRPVERQVEFRSKEDSCGSMLRCLYFAQSYIINSQYFTFFFVCLLVSHGDTNHSLLRLTKIGCYREGGYRQKLISRNLLTTSPKLSTLLYPKYPTIVCVCVCTGKEIQLKHRAPVIAIQIVDGNGTPLPEPYEVENQRAKAPDLTGSHRVLICSEEQFKVFNLPSLKPYGKFKLTAHEGAHVRKVGLAQFRKKTEGGEYSEYCLACLTNQGDLGVYSVPDLRRQLTATCCKKEDIKRFERFRQASGLINNPENEQVNMLVYCMGDNADDILLSCKIASDQLENYDKVIECFESHFIPRRNIIYERARFNQRCQQEGEKVNEFITALHSLAEHCNFEMLHDELIRDRIVVGVRDRALSERMQLDTDLTLVKATLMAKQLESVKEQQSSLYQQDSVDQIKKMPNHIKETKRHEPKIRQFKSNQLGGSSHGCTRCGNSNNHDWKNCPAMNSYCNKCMKKGHYAKVCRSEAINEIKSEIAFLGSVEDNSKKWIVPIKVNNRQVNFKIDTGADVNVLPLQYYYQSFQRIKLEKSDKVLQGPNGIPLETVGMIHVKLQNKGQHLNSKIYIVDKLKQPLLSGETSEKLNIVRMIQQLSSNFLNPKREFPKIFNGLGHAKINYKISLQPDAKPYALCTPRRVPIPLMKQVKEQLEEMTRLGVIESVEEPTEWCAGMVAVSKPGGKIRICVDLTKLNQYIRRENYPLPATEHILGQLGNACYFSKLDANSGFWQFGLAKESQKLTTFITPFGRFFFKRIPFGITSAPEIFQRKMTQLLGNIEGVVCFMDDIVVYGSSLEEHNERVRQVLKKIQEEGMTLNPEKCQFGVETVKFLGHTLSSEGLFIDEEKLDAITKMEAPRSTKELKSFLGMVNYLGKFIPNLADKLQPLNSLLSTKNEWVWDEPQKKSFNLLKQELVSRPNLALFDPSRTTIVSADASSFGIGGVLRQEQPDGSLKPIAYVSRTLSETKKRYSQIEKEGLAIVWTCERLKDYVTGIKIHIETDHKPLIAIFTSKSLEDMTPRLQRLKMRMMRYSYQISHIAGKKQIVADMLSRKPMSKPHKDELEEELSAYIQSIEFPATEERLLEISRKQKEDSLCSQLAKYCMSGWPKNKREVDPELRGYWQFQEDLTYQNGLLRGQRILIPKTLRKDILEKLHQGHFGINKCRSRAKESVWWYPEISLLQNLTAQEVISRLKSIFARHGTPETVRSDNGPQFQKVLGSEFSKFSKEWSFKHITSSPKFPQSNGFIEAIIKNIKQSFKKEEDCYLTLQAYRTMPLESGYSPAELLMGRRLRTSFPAIESSLMPRYLDSEALQEREKRRVINQKRLYDKRHNVHSLPPLQQGDSVWIRDQRVEGTVLHKSEEPRSYWVQTPQGKVRRNRLHLTPLPKMGSTIDASEDGQRQEQRNEETPTSTSTWLSRRCKDDQEQETEEDCPTPTASSTRDGRMQRDNQDRDPEKSLPSMPAVHTRYGRAVKIPRSGISSLVFTKHGQGFYLHSPCEFERFSMSARNITTVSFLLELPEGARPSAAAQENKEPEPASPPATPTLHEEDAGGEAKDASVLSQDVTIDSVRDHLNTAQATPVTNGEAESSSTLIVEKREENQQTVVTKLTTVTTREVLVNSSGDHVEETQVSSATQETTVTQMKPAPTANIEELNHIDEEDGA